MGKLKVNKISFLRYLIIFLVVSLISFSTMVFTIKKQASNEVLIESTESFNLKVLNKNFVDSDFIEKEVESELQKMTLRQKIAQIFIFRMSGSKMTPDFQQFLEINKPGGLIVMGDSVTPELKNFTEEIQKTNTIPLFISIDQEGGLVKRIKADPNPGAKILGEKSLDEVCSIQKSTTDLLNQNGVNLNFGIVADIAYDKKSFIEARSFGNNPLKVADNVQESVYCSHSELTTIKHFPGHGRTSVDSHKKTPEIDLSYADWKNSDAVPFLRGIDSNVDFVMFGHVAYPQIDNQPATLSKKWHDEIRKMGFEGLTITDDMSMLRAAGFDPTDSLVRAVNAGNDLLLYVDYPIPPTQMIDIIEKEVNAGRIPLARVEESVRRILVKKNQV